MNPKNPEQKEAAPLEFRKATLDDVDAFFTLEKDVITFNIANNIKTYSGIKTRDEAVEEIETNEVFLIYKNGALAGSVGYQIKKDDLGYISGVVVHPDFRGQGISTQEVMFCLEKLKNLQTVFLVTHPKNEAIIHIAKTCGFTETDMSLASPQMEDQLDEYKKEGDSRILFVKENEKSYL